MTCGRLYLYDTILKRLAQDLEDVAAALRQFIQEEHAVVCQRHVARPRHLSAADQPHIREGVMGARKGRVVTNAVRSPVRPAMRWRQVGLMASAPDFPAMLIPAVGRALLAER
jgi:hypothetical protein